MLWRGIWKLMEEMGELSQLLGKIGPFPLGKHPDGKGDLRIRMADEIADVYAALDYFVETNNFNDEFIQGRRAVKLAQFRKWILDGIPDPRQYPAIPKMKLLQRFKALWTKHTDAAPSKPLG